MQVFQTLVVRWISRCFGDESSKDKRERTHRFLEEALELGQAAGATQHEAHALVEYVYGRKAGIPEQEVGGVLLTLAGFCAAHDLEMNRCAAAEIARVNRPAMIEKCRIKQEDKKRNRLASPLPGREEIRWSSISSVDDAIVAQLREDVAERGATHDCGEWLRDGKCQLCDRQAPSKTIETDAWLAEHRPHLADGFDFVKNPIDHPDGGWFKLLCPCGAGHTSDGSEP
jgi:hypothetical protein